MGGRYKKGYTDSGKLIYGSVYAKSYREAKEKLHLAINIQNTPEATNKTSINLLYVSSAEETAPLFLCKYRRQQFCAL